VQIGEARAYVEHADDRSLTSLHLLTRSVLRAVE
jgi:hypothetical protein